MQLSLKVAGIIFSPAIKDSGTEDRFSFRPPVESDVLKLMKAVKSGSPLDLILPKSLL